MLKSTILLANFLLFLVKFGPNFAQQQSDNKNSTDGTVHRWNGGPLLNGTGNGTWQKNGIGCKMNDDGTNGTLFPHFPKFPENSTDTYKAKLIHHLYDIHLRCCQNNESQVQKCCEAIEANANAKFSEMAGDGGKMARHEQPPPEIKLNADGKADLPEWPATECNCEQCPTAPPSSSDTMQTQ